MSRVHLESVNITEADRGPGAGDHQYPPQSATRVPQGMSNFVDGSGPIFSMYSEMAAEEDKKLAEGWKADADGILIFTGLFSAAVASLISVSIQDIRPNPQDTSNFYLANIYQTIADPNRPSISIPSSPPPFSPPNYAVWVNALWFMSLAISLTCALLATLLQQWARRYLKVTQPRYSPHKRARVRAFFAEGVDKFLLPWVVEALPTLLHVSLFLFFAGLVVFVSNVDHTIFKLVLSWVGVCVALYGCITLIPIFRHDSPYYTPLTSLVWPTITGIPFVTFRALRGLTPFWDEAYNRFEDLEERYRNLLMLGISKTAEETALDSPSGVDARALMWTFDCLDEDHELERFFSGLPGFRSSKIINDPLPGLTREQKWELSTALMGLLDITFSSDLLPEPVKDRRAVICAKAFDPAHIPNVFDVFYKILSRYQYSGPVSSEIVQVMSGWRNDWDSDANLIATVCMIVAMVQQRDNSWFVLASNGLGVQETVLRNYATDGDSLSLAILIHITRQQFIHFWKGPWPNMEILEVASKFDVQNTSPDLQREFCALWNQIVLQVRNDNAGWMAFRTLGPIRNIYVAMHQDTGSAPTRFSVSTSNWDRVLWEPSSYPVCNFAGHIHDSASIAFVRTDLHDTAVPASASLASPDVPSSSALASLRVDECPTNVPPLDTYHLVHQTTIEDLRIPVISSDPATPDAFVPHPAPDAYASAPPLSSTSMPTAFPLQHNADPLTPSDAPTPPLSASLPDNMLPTSLPPSSHSPKTRRFDLPPSLPEAHS